MRPGIYTSMQLFSRPGILHTSPSRWHSSVRHSVSNPAWTRRASDNSAWCPDNLCCVFAPNDIGRHLSVTHVYHKSAAGARPRLTPDRSSLLAVLRRRRGTGCARTRRGRPFSSSPGRAFLLLLLFLSLLLFIVLLLLTLSFLYYYHGPCYHCYYSPLACARLLQGGAGICALCPPRPTYPAPEPGTQEASGHAADPRAADPQTKMIVSSYEFQGTSLRT